MNDFARGALTSRQTPFFCSLQLPPPRRHIVLSRQHHSPPLQPGERRCLPRELSPPSVRGGKKRAGPVAARTSLSSGSSVPPTSVTLQRSEQRQPAVR
ncbi:hypothetical protein MRX96_029687 [Rhipicephalus microplus]